MWGWAALLALAGGALAFQLLDRSLSQTALSRAELLGGELLAARSPDSAEAAARQLAALEENGVPWLVAALTAKEPLVAEVAAAEISRQLQDWRPLPRKTSAPRVAVLARELAAQREGIPLEYHDQVRNWAQVVLLWPLKNTSVDAGLVLADCEAILQMPLPDEELLEKRLALARNRLAMQTTSAPEVTLPELPAASEPAIMEVLPAEPNPLPLQMTDDPPPAEEPEQPYKRPREPRGLFPPRARLIDDVAPPEEPQVLPEPLPENQPAPLPESPAGGEVAEPSELEVMQDLHSADSSVAQEAADKLTRRGYKPMHLALARRLTDPDPKQRLALVEALPRVKGIDPRPWLLKLSEDADEEVRSAARSILKTSQDPELLNRLR